MVSALQLDKMTTLEKLRALEEIWTDLAKSPEDIPVPDWHADVLSAREKMIKEGKSTFTDWKETRRLIRDRTR